MSDYFGPWSSTLGNADRSNLSAFWKQRLALLRHVGKEAPKFSGRSVVWLALLGTAMLASPTVQFGAERGAERGTAVPIAVNVAMDLENVANAEPGRVSVSPAKGVAEFLPRPSDAERKIFAALGRPVEAEFDRYSLADALEFLSDYAEINIAFDNAGLERVGVTRKTNVSLAVKRVRLEAALRLLLQPLELDFVVTDDVLKITDAETAASTMFTRTYLVGDLCRTDEGYGNLLEVLRQTVEPESWVGENGTGTGVVAPPAGGLVIRQSFPVHQKIVKLLRTLRDARRQSKDSRKQSKDARVPFEFFLGFSR